MVIHDKMYVVKKISHNQNALEGNNAQNKSTRQ